MTLTFDLNINRDHLLIKYYLPTKFEASGAKRSWDIRCTRFVRLTWPLTLTFDPLTWIWIGIIYLSRTIYLPSLELLGQSVEGGHKYTCLTCHMHLWWVQLAKQETPTPPEHHISPIVSRGPWVSIMVLYYSIVCATVMVHQFSCILHCR